MSGAGARVQIVVAVIGLIGALGVALLGNWDKVFPQRSQFQPEVSPPHAPIQSTSTPIDLVDAKTDIQIARSHEEAADPIVQSSSSVEGAPVMPLKGARARPLPPPEPVYPVAAELLPSVKDFESLLGFTGTHGQSDVEELFGEPDRVEDGDILRYLYFLNSKLMVIISKSRREIYAIEIDGVDTVAKLRDQGVEDPRLHYVGIDRRILVQHLGEPDRPSSTIFYYGFTTQEHRGNVEFTCYKHSDFKCSVLYVRWFQ